MMSRAGVDVVRGRKRYGTDVLQCGRGERRRRVLLAYQARSDRAAYSAMAAGPGAERGLVATGRPGGARPARRPALDRRPPAGRLRSAARLRRRTGCPAAVL